MIQNFNNNSFSFSCSLRDNRSDLPIRPPPTTDQMPCSWWNPKCCDKSLLVGTYKHGCESYRQMRADPSLCYISHCGPGEVTDDISICKE